MIFGPKFYRYIEQVQDFNYELLLFLLKPFSYALLR